MGGEQVSRAPLPRRPQRLGRQRSPQLLCPPPPLATPWGLARRGSPSGPSLRSCGQSGPSAAWRRDSPAWRNSRSSQERRVFKGPWGRVDRWDSPFCLLPGSPLLPAPFSHLSLSLPPTRSEPSRPPDPSQGTEKNSLGTASCLLQILPDSNPHLYKKAPQLQVSPKQRRALASPLLATLATGLSKLFL